MGEGILEYNKIDTLNEVICRLKTKGIFTKIYPVNDFYRSLSRADFTSIIYEKDIKEGKYSAYVKINYFEDSIVYSDKRKYNVDKRYYDLFSALFMVRNIEIKINDSLILPIHTGGKPSSMKIKIEDGGIIETGLGKEKTILLIPYVKDEKIFGKDGELKIYISCVDKIPVLIKSKLFFGELSFILKWKE